MKQQLALAQEQLAKQRSSGAIGRNAELDIDKAQDADPNDSDDDEPVGASVTDDIPVGGTAKTQSNALAALRLMAGKDPDDIDEDDDDDDDGGAFFSMAAGAGGDDDDGSDMDEDQFRRAVYAEFMKHELDDRTRRTLKHSSTKPSDIQLQNMFDGRTDHVFQDQFPPTGDDAPSPTRSKRTHDTAQPMPAGDGSQTDRRTGRRTDENGSPNSAGYDGAGGDIGASAEQGFSGSGGGGGPPAGSSSSSSSSIGANAGVGSIASLTKTKVRTFTPKQLALLDGSKQLALIDATIRQRHDSLSAVHRSLAGRPRDNWISQLDDIDGSLTDEALLDGVWDLAEIKNRTTRHGFPTQDGLLSFMRVDTGNFPSQYRMRRRKLQVLTASGEIAEGKGNSDDWNAIDDVEYFERLVLTLQDPDQVPTFVQFQSNLQAQDRVNALKFLYYETLKSFQDKLRQKRDLARLKADRLAQELQRQNIFSKNQLENFVGSLRSALLPAIKTDAARDGFNNLLNTFIAQLGVSGEVQARQWLRAIEAQVDLFFNSPDSFDRVRFAGVGEAAFDNATKQINDFIKRGDRLIDSIVRANAQLRKDQEDLETALLDARDIVLRFEKFRQQSEWIPELARDLVEQYGEYWVEEEFERRALLLRNRLFRFLNDVAGTAKIPIEKLYGETSDRNLIAVTEGRIFNRRDRAEIRSAVGLFGAGAGDPSIDDVRDRFTQLSQIADPVAKFFGTSARSLPRPFTNWLLRQVGFEPQAARRDPLWHDRPSHSGAIILSPFFTAALQSAYDYVRNVCGRTDLNLRKLIFDPVLSPKFKDLIGLVYLPRATNTALSRFPTRAQVATQNTHHARLKAFFQRAGGMPQAQVGLRPGQAVNRMLVGWGL